MMKKLLTLSVIFVSLSAYSQTTMGFILPSLTFKALTTNSATKAKITYSDHLEAARSHRIPMLENYGQMDELVENQKLMPVPESGLGYTTMKLTHSKAYLTPKSTEILANIGKRFATATDDKFFTVTSMTRTAETQAKLRRVNSNAAAGDSSHNYGASFDISYVRFNKVVGANASLEKKLESVLKELQEEGKIYYIKEYKQRCFHITVIGEDNNLPKDLVYSEHNH